MANIRYDYGSIRGSEEVLRTIKKRFKPGAILFGILSFIFLAMFILGFAFELYVLVAMGMIFFLPMMILWLIFLVRFLKPEKSGAIRKNPDLLSQADFLFSNICWQNDFIVASPGYFAPKSDLTRIFAGNEVLLLYKRIVSMNYGATQYFLVVETVRGSVLVPYLKKMEQAVDEAVQYVVPGCPYVHLGHSQENLNYVEYMRTMWQEAQAHKGQ